MVETTPDSDWQTIKELLRHSGYLCMSEDERWISFNKGYTEQGFADRVFHLHLRHAGDNHELYFRDYLLEHPAVAKEYEALKLTLWKKYEHDRDAYTEAKGDFVKMYAEKAQALYKSRYEKVIIETDRLYLREMWRSDYPDLCRMLQDDDVMYAYEGAFSDEEVQAWLDKQLLRYQKDGFGLWAVILKTTGQMIGQCGLTIQDCNGRQVVEIGYLFQKSVWHNGYATEAARACKEYAFNTLKESEVYSIIRDTNTASQNVAIRNGMIKTDSLIKHYRGVEMPHDVFSVKRGAEDTHDG